MEKIDDLKISIKELRDTNKQSADEIWSMLRELGKQIGGLGNKFGSFTEGFAYNSMVKILSEQYGIENTAPRFKKKAIGGDVLAEYDVFGYVNGKVNNAVIVEVKSHLRREDVESFVEKLRAFKAHFPEHKDKHLYGILATADIISQDLKEQALASGIHLASIHDEIFSLEKNPNVIDFNQA